MAAKTRRWLRFSLRAMLAAVTILCVWLGWESSVVRRRQQLIRQAEAEGYEFIGILTVDGIEMLPRGTIDPPDKISFIRHWLGDKPVNDVYYYEFSPGYSQQRLLELMQAFPEATFQARLREADL
jgi:hypothetical protein